MSISGKATSRAERPASGVGKPRLPRAAAKSVDHPLIDALHLLGGKWALHVLHQLHAVGRPIRFRELQRLIPGVTQKELTKRLRELERAGIILRTVFAQMPLRVEYAVAPLGKSLVEPLSALASWAERHAAAIARHRSSDT